MTEVDGVMRMLSDANRRRLLMALREGGPIHPFADADDDRNQAIQLHHVDLPLLEDTDLVAWNRDTGTVRKGDSFEAVEPFLGVLDAGGLPLPDGSVREAE